MIRKRDRIAKGEMRKDYRTNGDLHPYNVILECDFDDDKD